MFLTLRGTRLHVDVSGSAWRWVDRRLVHAPPLFMLHGGPGSNHLSPKMGLDFLNRWFQLFYVDHRGCGLSGPCPPHTLDIANNAEDVEALRRALGFGKIGVLGASYGGMVAAEYATRYPGNLSLLFLLGTAGSGDFIRAAREYLDRHGSPAQVAAARRLWTGNFRNPRQIAAYYAALGPLYRRRKNPKTWTNTIFPAATNLDALNRGFRDLLPRWNALGKLRRVRAPVFIGVGRHDWICPVSQSEALARRLPHAVLRVYGRSGHDPSLDQPGAFRRDVAAFLRRHLPKVG